MNKQNTLHHFGNLVGLIIISIILGLILFEQFYYHDVPCPLCLLQRICYVAIGLCFMMNLRVGVKPAHYGVMILATLLGLAVSIRQIFIHLGPHDSGYGTPFLGMYLYSWSAVGYLIILILIACALIFDKGFDSSYKTDNKIVFALMGILLILIFTNGVSTFIECGWYICPDNPIHYYF